LCYSVPYILAPSLIFAFLVDLFNTCAKRQSNHFFIDFFILCLLYFPAHLHNLILTFIAIDEFFGFTMIFFIQPLLPIEALFSIMSIELQHAVL